MSHSRSARDSARPGAAETASAGSIPRSTAPKLLSSPAGQLAAIAMGAAFIAAVSLVPGIKVTPTVPFTLQIMAITLVAFLFNGRVAGAATALYVLLGALGLPIFSGGRSGAAVLAGPTGGYLIGFILAAAVMGFLATRSHPSLRAGKKGRAMAIMIAAGLLGCLVIHAAGVLGLMSAAHMPLAKAVQVTAVFVPFDIIKIVIASVIAVPVLNAFRSQLLTREAVYTGSARR